MLTTCKAHVRARLVVRVHAADGVRHLHRDCHDPSSTTLRPAYAVRSEVLSDARFHQATGRAIVATASIDVVAGDELSERPFVRRARA